MNCECQNRHDHRWGHAHPENHRSTACRAHIAPGQDPTNRQCRDPGCTPGPTCTGPHGTWGLGWTNNPDNLDYPPNRLPYLQASYADAAHPASWPYQERVMGWMASPIQRYGAKAYAKPTYNGGKTWLQIPAFTRSAPSRG